MGAFEASARQSGPKGLLPADDFTTLSRNYQALQPNLFPSPKASCRHVNPIYVLSVKRNLMGFQAMLARARGTAISQPSLPGDIAFFGKIVIGKT
ncbi:MAG: hypothetical protein J0I31_21125 [Rhizobiales bacterium]|nr:hypothetical protein [Hyphomicrobiales bacterium]